MRPETESMPESLVVADVGRRSSRAYLLEQIGGALRFVVAADYPMEAAPAVPAGDQWQPLLRHLEVDAGRRLRGPDGLLMPQSVRGEGVDAVMVCSARAEALRIAVLEAGRSQLSTPLIEAIKRLPTRHLHLSAPSGRKERGWVAAAADLVGGFRPDILLLLVGDRERRASARVIQVVSTVTKSQPVLRAEILADGDLHDKARAAFSAQTTVQKISVRGRATDEIIAGIERELHNAWNERVAKSADVTDLADDETGRVITRTRAVDLVNRYVASAFHRQPISIAIDDDGAHVHWATKHGDALSADSNLDSGPGLAALDSLAIADAVAWLPFEASPEELARWIQHRALSSSSRFSDPQDVAIEQAFVRLLARRGLVEIARTNPTALAGADLVIGGPWFGRWGQPGAAALVLLDSIDVVPDSGVLDLALDQDGLMIAAGTIASLHPRLASDVIDHDALVHLGTAVVLGGPVGGDETACRIELHRERAEMTTFTVRAGNVEVLPLHPGENATMVLRPERRYSVGGYAAGESVAFSGDRRIIGGTVGAIVDARGRSLSAGINVRPSLVKRWLDTVNRERDSLHRLP